MAILRKLAAWGVVGIAALVLVIFAMPSYRQGEASVAGRTARDFPLEIAGKPGHLADLKGRVVVLNFWATWCPPCVEETPALNRLQKYIESRNGVILGVAADEDPEAYERFLHEQRVGFLTYRDPATRENHSPIAQEYGTSMYPETYVIDRHGTIARKFIGFQHWDSPGMLAYFDGLLGPSSGTESRLR